MRNSLLINGVLIDWNKIGRDSYLRGITAISGVDEISLKKPITFFVGENGSGKSTLLEAIAIAYGFNPEGGTRNYAFSTYDSHSELCNAIRLKRGVRRAGYGYFLRAESFYNVATKEMDYADGDHPSLRFHERSHGESFLTLAQNSFKPNGIYLLDEGGVTVHHRDAFADPARDAGRGDPELRRRGGPPVRVRGDGQLPGHFDVHQS